MVSRKIGYIIQQYRSNWKQDLNRMNKKNTTEIRYRSPRPRKTEEKTGRVAENRQQGVCLHREVKISIMMMS